MSDPPSPRAHAILGEGHAPDTSCNLDRLIQISYQLLNTFPWIAPYASEHKDLIQISSCDEWAAYIEFERQ
jgi:hypothetical protein